jgi:cellulose synthase/poly-beta-1,6-N-acetylglucosamine synthase-like glycosyltransferase
VIALLGLYDGTPPWAQAILLTALVVIVGSNAWVVILFVRSRVALHHLPEPFDESPAQLLWVAIVPALDEEVTIVDSVGRLLELDAPNRLVLVVDDGSTDRTPELLEELRSRLPDGSLSVLRRDPPNARLGKAAALNAAWRHLHDVVLRSGRFAGWDPEDVIVTIVDADGRLDPDSPRFVAAHFADPRVGGVQSLVRIYNRHHLLTWCQDVEFGIYGELYQLGRSRWGTAGMGGNGQFNRLAALDSLVDAGDIGPWRDRLTEDQDIGLRLIALGWAGRQEVRTAVDQQGLPGIRRLYRQRTRWSQGNLQAMRHLPAVARAPVRLGARLDLVAYLLNPVWQAIVGLSLVTGMWLFAFDGVPFWTSAMPWWLLIVTYSLGFTGAVLGTVARSARRTPWAWLVGLLIAQPYALYSWLLFPVLVRAALRLVVRRDSWAKTEREPVPTPA